MKDILRYLPRLAVKVALLAILAEGLVMSLLYWIDIASPVLEALADSLLLALLLTPFLVHWGRQAARMFSEELQASHRQLLESEARGRLILDSAGDGIIGVDNGGRILFANAAAQDMLGWNLGELEGRELHPLIHHTRPDGTRYPVEDCPMHAAFTADKESHVEDEVLWRRDGGSFYVSYSARPMVNYGRTEGAVITFRDVTERRKAEEEIRKLNHRNQEIQKISNEIMGLALADHPLPEILERIFKRILSVPFLTIQSRGAVFLADNRAGTLEMVAQHGLADPIRRACSRLPFGRCLCGRAALSGETVFSGDLDERHEVTYDGIKPHGHYCVPIKSGAEVLGVLNLYLEAGHRKERYEIEFLEGVANLLSSIILRKRVEAEIARAQEQLVQSEKMSAVGQLAAGVAHEINNPLGIILGFAQGLVSRIRPDDPAAMPLMSIERETLRCKNLVQDLLVFSRTSKIEEEPVDLNEAVGGALSLITARAKTHGIEIARSLAPDLPKVPASGNRIQQVLINLANNAIDAMPEGGTISIATSVSTARPGYVELRVADSGHGIPVSIRTRIMEPFFTTKEAGKGTGLGLALVYEIIKKHKGSLELSSQEGKGTTFVVYLPVRAPVPAAPDSISGPGEGI